ncbi:MAG: AMP-binding protein [Gammaproteobacteria bacterium]|nr:AMP-binding protein [Gammaproteobacteria bacterium]
MQFQFDNIADRTLSRLLDHQTKKRPDAPFFQFCDNGWLTFSQMEALSACIAGGLYELGLSKGHKLAIVTPNCAEFVPIWFAAARLGAIEVPMDCNLKGRMLLYVLRDCTASILVVHADCLGSVVDALADNHAFKHVIVIGEPYDDAIARKIVTERVVSYNELAHAPAKRPNIDLVQPSDPIAILYTSGTTGPAKGVVMPHHQFYVFVETFADHMGLTSDDSYFTPLPLFHGDAQLFGVYYPLVYGTRGTVYDRFSASRFFDQVRLCQATATNLLGAMAHIVWKQPRRADDNDNSVRVCQALPMIPFKEEFEERFGFKLVTGYGQTETNFVTYDTVDNQRLNSCGKVTEGFELAVVDSDDNFLPPGEIGEIVIRANIPWSTSLGYFGKDDKSIEANRNQWFHTGDAGWLDKDGWLYFANRIKDVIRRRGKNISAYEIETTINAHPAVLESAAVAVPSELSEDEIKVVVSLRPNHSLSPMDLLTYCEMYMPQYMLPRYVEFRSRLLPRTPSEKIAKECLRDEGITLELWDSESPELESGTTFRQTK